MAADIPQEESGADEPTLVEGDAQIGHHGVEQRPQRDYGHGNEELAGVERDPMSQAGIGEGGVGGVGTGGGVLGSHATQDGTKTWEMPPTPQATDSAGD